MILFPKYNTIDPLFEASRHSITQAYVDPVTATVAAGAAGGAGAGSTLMGIGGIVGGIGGLAGGLAPMFGGGDEVEYKETPLEKQQKILNSMRIASQLSRAGIDPSVAGNPQELSKLFQSGVLNDFLSDPANFVYQGQRVADLNPLQIKEIARSSMYSDAAQNAASSPTIADQILRESYGRETANPLVAPIEQSTVEGNTQIINDYINAAKENQQFAAPPTDVAEDAAAYNAWKQGSQPKSFGNWMDKKWNEAEGREYTKEERKANKRGDTQVVGEDGPEIITATEDAVVVPNGNTATARQQGSDSIRQQALQQSNPLAIESNTVGANPIELLEETQLPGMAQGGYLQPGQSAVVGEQGPETLVNATTQATQRALSGNPTTDVNQQTTRNFVQKAIADPARKNFEENTKQQINSAYSGPGQFWGSARAKATQKGAQDTEDNIASLGAQYSYADEQARRSLAESSANRSLSAINTSLNVQNNPLAQQATQAGISATQAGTEATRFSTQRGQQMLPGELQTQQAGIQQALANVGLTQAQVGQVEAQVGQILANTEMTQIQQQQALRNIGLTEAQTDALIQNTAITGQNQQVNLEQQGLTTEAMRLNNIAAQQGIAVNSLMTAGIPQDYVNSLLQSIMEQFSENTSFGIGG